MFYSGFVGGWLGDRLLERLGRQVVEQEIHNNGARYADQSKLELLLGKDIWSEINGRVVVDFGSGNGLEAIEMAKRGASKVIGVESRQRAVDIATEAARREGVDHLCEFTTSTDHQADVIISLDGFEHFDEPGEVLNLMQAMLKPGGRVITSFGPTWFHPYGGHLFSIFPWAHLIFTEQALIRWRSHFKSDGARHFNEVEGGLNQMTIKRFEQLVRDSDFEILEFDAVPIRKLKWASNPLTREFVTAVVRCTLQSRASDPGQPNPG